MPLSPNYGIVAGSLGNNINVSAGTTSTNISSVVFSNSNGVSFGINGSTITASAAGGANVNFSAGTTSNNLSQITFSNSNGISFGLNGSTLTATVKTDYLTTAMLSNAATISNINISAGTTSNNLSAVVFSNAKGMNFGLNGSTITASRDAEQFYSPPWGYSGRATNSALGNRTLYFMPFDTPVHISASRINFYISVSAALSAANTTATGHVSMGYAIYTLNSDSLSLVTSYAMVLLSHTMNSNTQYVGTHYIGLSNVTSHSTSQFNITATNASTYAVTSLQGPRVVAMPINTTLFAGRHYLGVSFSSSAANTGISNPISYQMTSVGLQPDVRPFGVNSAGTNASVFRAMQGWGSYSATSGAWPNSIAFTTDHIRAAVNQTLVHFDILGISTNTNFI